MVEARLAIFDGNGTDFEKSKYESDPARLFIKREAHSVSKIADRRWRLIWGVSLIDRIIDMMLYLGVIDATIENCDASPIKVGMNFKKGGVDKLVREKHHIFGPSVRWSSYDAKQFDFTVPAWALWAVRQLNEQLCNYA